MAVSLDIALTGLTAQTRRLDASASNTANIRTKGALPDTQGRISESRPAESKPADGKPAVYRAVEVAQSEQRVGNDGAGTRAIFKPVTPAYLPEYEPDASFANADGFVAAPNVDPARESVNQITASRLYKANVQVARTADEMLRSVLDAKV